MTDHGKSAEWYGESLGFEIDADIDGAGFRRIRLRAPGSEVGSEAAPSLNGTDRVAPVVLVGGYARSEDIIAYLTPQ